MISIQKIIVRLFLALEVMVFSLLYVFGSQGIITIRKLQHEDNNIRQEIAQLEQETTAITQEITAWQTDAFYKEKVAREELQLARDGDEIYYIGEKVN